MPHKPPVHVRAVPCSTRSARCRVVSEAVLCVPLANGSSLSCEGPRNAATKAAEAFARATAYLVVCATASMVVVHIADSLLSADKRQQQKRRKVGEQQSTRAARCPPPRSYRDKENLFPNTPCESSKVALKQSAHGTLTVPAQPSGSNGCRADASIPKQTAPRSENWHIGAEDTSGNAGGKDMLEDGTKLRNTSSESLKMDPLERRAKLLAIQQIQLQSSGVSFGSHALTRRAAVGR
eukprot:6182189-Pleurochrysis_carterae.AAC.1